MSKHPGLQIKDLVIPGLLLLAGGILIIPSPVPAQELGMEPLPGSFATANMRKLRVSPEFVPSSLDWRNSNCITPAEDQGSCGSCYIFAATATVEAMAILAGAPGDIDISEQEILSCFNFPIDIGGYMIQPDGCRGGYGAAIFEYLKTRPAVFESGFPYEGGDFSGAGYPLVECHDAQSTGWTVTSWNVVQTSETNGIPTTEELKAALQYGPLWVGYMVHDDFYTYWFSGSSQSPPYSFVAGTFTGWHAVLLIGYDDSSSSFICKNSWGANAGPNQNGTFRISYTSNCYFGRDATWIEVTYNEPLMNTSIEEMSWGQIKVQYKFD